MVDQTLVQSKVNRGFAISAQKLGSTFVHYRPQTGGPPFVNTNIVQELYLAYDQNYKFTFEKSKEFNNPVYFALMDLTYVGIGDYLTDYVTTFFVAGIDPLRPAEIIECNRTIDLYLPSGSVANGYGGNTDPIHKLSGWPVALVPGTKGEMNEAKTPGSVRAPWGTIMMPNLPPPLVVNEYDLIIDDRGFRFITSTVSQAEEGYYLSVDTELA